MNSRRILSLVLVTPTVLAFIFPTPTMTQNPDVMKYTDAQTGTMLNIRLDVGEKDALSRMNVNGILVSLVKDRAGKDRIKMPGADGPNPSLSSGVRKLNLLQHGHTIDLSGSKAVEMHSGCWEISWKKGAPAGSLVCGFDVPKTVTRNDAKLSTGRVYLSFPLWTQEGLNEAQIEKERVLNQAKQFMDEKKEELAKFQTTNNPIMKALHYRNAAQAIEKYTMIPVNKVKVVPSDEEVIPIEDNLLLTTKGLIWFKEGRGSGTFYKTGTHILLGSAHVSAGSQP